MKTNIMKKLKTSDRYIIRLEYVPKAIEVETNGDIRAGMHLMSSAVDSLLNGQMISGFDCFWKYADTFDENTAIKVCNQLTKFNMVGFKIKIMSL